MEITKPNDIFVATIGNPQATTYDLMTLNVTPQNSSLFTKEEYKGSKFVQDTFKDKEGKFDEIAFNNAFNAAEAHYLEMSDAEYLKNLTTVQYSPFDITRPKDAKTFKVEVAFEKDYNPFKQLYGRTGINSIDDNKLSLREIAQQNKVFDPKTNTWSKESANELGLLNKFFGDTLVYAQWEEDGMHVDEASTRTLSHKKGDWKVNAEGNIYLEKLGDREVYGKQVANPMDMLTTDGSFANQFDFLDSDSKNKSIVATTLKIATDIAPFLIPIPGLAQIYGGVKAAVSLASVLPTFYKSIEGLLLGDTETGLTKVATAAEGYMSKFTTSSISDNAQGSLFNYEQMGQMVGDIFSQIYEQRAMASLSKFFTKGQQLQLKAKEQEYSQKILGDVLKGVASGKIPDMSTAQSIAKAAMAKVPQLKELEIYQSGMAKTLSLGYMALTSTADIYGEALAGGYDRRTAGFAALAAATGQYGIMVNNRMGDWFLDKTTGYTTETNKAMIRKSVKEYYEDIQKGMNLTLTDSKKGKVALAETFKKIRGKLFETFTSPSELGEAIFKNAFIEGVEEVTEQAVLDATKGIVDTMSYLGMTKSKGSFGGVSNVFSKEGLENYVANLVGGILGGGMFEIQRSKIEPWLNSELISQDTSKSVQRLIANGQTQEVINELNKNRSKWGNNFVAVNKSENGEVIQAAPGHSQADVITDVAISTVNVLDGIMNSKGLAVSDEEIIKKALLDEIILKDLEDSKQGGKIGIEGVIIDDFRNASAQIIKITGDIQKLSQTPESTKENTELISELKEDLKIYEQRVEDIKSGKDSEKYFTQALFYLSKPISENWLTIDRVTFTKNQYGKDYYSLRDSGYGITKELIDKEWTEYQDSTDLRKHIEVATNSFLELEKESNKSISDYVDTGYIEERKKSISKLLDIVGTLNLFDVSNPAKKLAVLNNYIQNSKEVEIATGKRMIPWDVVAIDIASKFIKEGVLSSTEVIQEDGTLEKTAVSQEYLDQKLTFADETKTRREFIENILNLIISQLPAESLVYDTVAHNFNDIVKNHNSKIDLEISQLLETKTPQNEAKIESKIVNLDNQKLKVKLDLFKESISFQKQAEKLTPNLISKQTELQLSDNVINTLRDEGTLTKKETSYERILNDYAKTLDKTSLELTDDEKSDAIKNSEIVRLYNRINPLDTNISGLLSSENENKFLEVEKIINAFIDSYNQYLPKFKEYTDFENELLGSIEMPEIFNTNNYALDAIISEIKTSKNLDGELFKMLSKMYQDLISTLKHQFFNGWQLDNEDVMDLFENSKDIASNLQTYVAEYLYSGTDIEIPKYLSDLIDSFDYDEKQIFALEGAVSNLADQTKSMEKTITKVKEVREVLKNTSNSISNTLYDFLDNFVLHLYKKKSENKNTVFSILKNEELNLLKAPDITSYWSEGVDDKSIKQAINTIDLLKSVILGMSTTTVDMDEPYGLIASRKAFAEKHELESEIKKLKTLKSDEATLMMQDLNRIKSRLQFLIALSENNSGKIFIEQELIRTEVTKLLISEWKRLLDTKIRIKEKPAIPDLSEILNSTDSNEKKLLNIEDAFYKHNMALSKEDRLDLTQQLIKEYKYTNSVAELYDKDGIDKITKDIRTLSRNDILMYMISNLVVNSKDFNNKLLKTLQGEEFKKSPFYTQELAVKIAYASIVEPELFAAASIANAHEHSQLTEYITYTLGSAGTGKTTVVLKSLLLMLKDKNPNMTVWFAAPHTEQANKLYEDVLRGVDSVKMGISEKFSKQALFERLKITKILQDIHNPTLGLITAIDREKLVIDFDKIIFEDTISDLPNILFIDEVTHFTAIELAVMNELMKKVNLAGNSMKIIGAGDPTQMGATSELYGDLLYNVDRVSGTFPPQLTLSVRSLNSQKRQNTEYLTAIVSKANVIYETSKDAPKVLDLINNGIALKYYLSDSEFNGDLVTPSGTIPEQILITLKNSIDKAVLEGKSPVIIGILSDTMEIDSVLQASLDKLGIPSSNIKIYTEGTVQGSETDYFIFKASAVKAPNIARSLKKLNTFLTRSKSGSIMINDESIVNFGADDSILKVFSEKEDTTRNILPLSDTIIEENRQQRIKDLMLLLDPNFNINYDNFKFNSTSEILSDEPLVDNIATGEELELSSDDQQKLISSLRITDDYNYMLHTFYNDLNVSYIVSADKKNIVIKRNESSDFEYGLGPFLKGYPADSSGNITLGLSKFQELADNYVNLKYDVWKLKTSKGTFSLPADNTFFKELVGGSYLLKNHPSKLVIRKSIYSDAYNAPFAKEGDIKAKHLKTGDPYFNLFLEVKLNGVETYSIHLATLPNEKTCTEFFTKHLGTGNKSSKAYANFLKSAPSRLEIKSEQVTVKTSTRLIANDENPVKNNLRKLTATPGLKFHNGSTFTSVPSYALFPSGADNFDAFKQIYKRTSFGEQISEEQLSKMYFGYEKDGKKIVGYAGKPYAEVSMVDDRHQAQIVLLKSGTRTIKEILALLKNPYKADTPKSAKTIIRYSKAKSDEAKRIHTFTDTLFSGNQVLDMLLNLAIDKPDLFAKFFHDGSEILAESAKTFDKTGNLDLAKEYLSGLSSEFESDLLTHITFTPKGGNDILRKVMETIQATVTKVAETGKELTEQDKKALKSELLLYIKQQPNWYTKFWNFFSFKNTVDSITIDDRVLDVIQEHYKQFQETMDAIINYWEGFTQDKIYYNLPLKKAKGGAISTNENEWALDYLYTTLTPEGLYAMVDLSKEVAGIVTPTDNSEEALITAYTETLSKITIDDEAILSASKTDNSATLLEKINKAKLIKEIINHPKNTTAVSDGYDLKSLIPLSIEDLKGIEAVLKSRKTPKKAEVATLEILLKDINESVIVNEDMANSFVKLLQLFDLPVTATAAQGMNVADRQVIQNLIDSWNKKAFKQIIKDSAGNFSFGTKKDLSLKDFMLQIFSMTEGQLGTLFNEPDLEYISSTITGEIFEALKIDKDLEKEFTEDLFDNCRI